MFLAINIGNSLVKFGIFDGGELLDVRTAPSSTKTGEQFWEIIKKPLGRANGDGPKIEKIGIASVVPVLTEVFAKLAGMHLSLQPYILDSNCRYDFKILYDDPTQIGADRLANVIAARAIYGYPAIVVDIGTATTFSVINVVGDFTGGPIAPGPATSAESLFSRGARLFPVQIEKPDKLIAQNTSDAMKAGIYYGSLGQIDYLISSIKGKLGGDNVRVIVTGGMAELFAPDIAGVDSVDPHLTLRGIYRAFAQSGNTDTK